jgi:hypothetical protein
MSFVTILNGHMLPVFFIYGLAFFCLGLTASLQHTERSTFELRKCLWALGLFGFLHGMSEWADMFSQRACLPLNAAWLDHPDLKSCLVRRLRPPSCNPHPIDDAFSCRKNGLRLSLLADCTATPRTKGTTSSGKGNEWVTARVVH